MLLMRTIRMNRHRFPLDLRSTYVTLIAELIRDFSTITEVLDDQSDGNFLRSNG